MKGKWEKKTGKSKWPRVLLLIPVLTLLTAMLGAKLILAGMMPQSAVRTLAIAFAGINALILGLIGAICSPQKKLLWGLLTAVLYAAALLLGNLLFFGVAYGAVLPVCGAVLGGGMVGALLGSRKRRKFA